MRILFVAPYPLSRIRIRSYSLVAYLSKAHYVKVLVLCAGKRELADVQTARENGFVIDAVVEWSPVQYLRSLSALCSHLPLQVAFAASSAWQSAIEAELNNGHYDLLHVETLRALGALPLHLPIPVICDMVDCISHLYTLGARAGATAMMRTIGMIEAYRVRLYEQAQLRHFSHILVTSEQDRQRLLRLIDQGDNAARYAKTTKFVRDRDSDMGLQHIIVLPNGVDQAYFAPYAGPRRAETLVFSGKLSYHANVAAALYLMKHILPRIWRQRPSVRLILAGSDPPWMLRRLARHPRIELTGYVPDLRPYIAQAQVAVCPLPYAVGIQNKVLEALALGTPVVASPCAIAGLQAVAGRDLLVADHPDAFASTVLHLLDSQPLRQRLASSGLNYVATNHNWESIAHRLTIVYEQALSK
jgi:glycosyltransferase involved in cell wall biosynthesis